ncbi:MAG: hypothetical protein K2P94_07305 [Rhodospirillaceae bacterium]|nr:hypothetical protein [Rhodospirillaceae bacterium]
MRAVSLLSRRFIFILCAAWCLTPLQGWAATAEQNLYFIAVNTTRPPLNIREVRHALGMSIDREGLARLLRLKDASPAYAMVPPGLYGDSPHGNSPYMPLRGEMRAAIAEVLLGERAIDPAHPVTVMFIYPQGGIHAAVVKSFADVVIKFGVRVKPLEKSPADYAQSLRDGDFDLAIGAWTEPGKSPADYLRPFTQGSDPRNIARYAEPDFEQRFLEAEAEVDPMRRMIILADAENVLIQDQPILPVFFFAPTSAAGQGLSVLQP